MHIPEAISLALGRVHIVLSLSLKGYDEVMMTENVEGFNSLLPYGKLLSGRWLRMNIGKSAKNEYVIWNKSFVP